MGTGYRRYISADVLRGEVIKPEYLPSCVGNEIIAAHIYAVVILRYIEDDFHIVIQLDFMVLNELLDSLDEFIGLFPNFVIVQIGVGKDALETLQVSTAESGSLLSV